ncbi:MAG: glucans biosynthesis glucosyltransferase MdoH [Pseudomonadota bacterium]
MIFADSAVAIDEIIDGKRLHHHRWRWAFLGLTVCLSGFVVGASALAIDHWNAASFIALVLIGLCAVWIAGGAATAVIGTLETNTKARSAPADWTPSTKTAVLVTLCGEDPKPVATYLAGLRSGLVAHDLAQSVAIFVLSDTQDRNCAAAEEVAFADLSASGQITYRRRVDNVDRKPGNIAEWIHAHGAAFDHMIVLDADSRMTAARINRLIWRLEANPRTGLIQAGMALVPAQTRFGHHQRNAVRLLAGNFGRGMAAWAGSSGNYWGHNAIIRLSAFRTAVPLPRLTGNAPLGGSILSHDFIEAAWIRRAGWMIELDHDVRGSAEDGPQTLESFHRRDRRWCQGNLQHLRLILTPGLHPISRLHLLGGILGYLASPLWLALVALIAFGWIPIAGVYPLFAVLMVLLIPHVCAAVTWARRAKNRRHRLIVARAWINQLFLSSVVAPLIMVRQAASVGSVLMGRDCGWKSGRQRTMHLPDGVIEASIGLAILGLSLAIGPQVTIWLVPLLAPLLLAPIIIRLLNAPR